MASSQLTRIAELVERLTPLGGKRRGMRIEADEWNALVDGLLGILEIDRAQERTAESALADNFARRDHAHLGQVALEWLDAELQARLSGEAGGGTAVRGLVGQLDRRVAALGDEVVQLTRRDELRQQALDRAAADDLERGRALRGFEGRFASLESLRTVVNTVSGQVGALGTNVDAVLKLREVLSDPTGAPIDLNRLRRDVVELQGIRDNLKGVDGNPLRLRDIELKLTDLADIVGAGGTQPLADRISASVGAAESRLNARINAQTQAVRTELLDASRANADHLRDELQASVKASEATLAQQAATQSAAGEVRLGARLDERVAAANATLRAELTAAAGATIDARLAGLPAQIGQAVNAARAGLEQSLRTTLTESLTTVLAGRVAEAEGRLGQRVAVAEARVAGLADGLPGLVDARIEAGRAGLLATVDQRVADRTAQLQATLDSGLTQRIAAITGASFESLSKQLDGLVQQRTAELTTQVNTALQTALSRVSVQVGEAVRAELTSLNLDARFEQLSGRLSAQFRAELDRAVTTLRADVTTQQAENTKILRTEIAAAQRNATEDAVVRGATQRDALRDELIHTIDTRVTTITTTPRITGGVGPLINPHL